jgi:hypothetical protein
VSGIGSPASGFKRSGVEEAVVDGDKSFANAVGDFGEVTGS